MPKMWTKFDPLFYPRLLELLNYDPQTGWFTWRVNRGGRGRAMAGDRAGSLDKQGYRYIVIDGRACQAHTLAWFLSLANGQKMKSITAI